MTAGEAIDFFATRSKTHRVYPVVDDLGILKGRMSRGDALRWQQERVERSQPLADLVSDNSVPLAHPDDTVGYVADLMLATDAGRIPIVDPDNGQLVGLVARKDLLRLRHSLRASETERRPYFGRAVGSGREVPTR
jgi:CBS domain-containing protein